MHNTGFTPAGMPTNNWQQKYTAALDSDCVQE